METAARIDLHTHSTASDGSQPPADVVRRAAAAGVGVLALTDHDTLSGVAEAAAALPPGVVLVPGVEVSCVLPHPGGDAVSLHLLGYLVDPADAALADLLAGLREDRVTRARRMVERLRGLGAPVTWEQVCALAGGEAVGRPHVARALVDAGAAASLQDAFGPDWIGHGGRGWVAKPAADARGAVRAVAAAGGVSVLAHVGAWRRGPVLDEAQVREVAAAGLHGLEVDHPDHDPPTRERLRGLAAALDLAVTGSSDDHGAATGHRIGCETTAPDQLERLLAAASGARPVVAGGGG